MIPLPTRKRLVRRRDELYERLQSVISHASPQEVEDYMRRIHILNYRILAYFVRENEPKEVFDEP